MGSLWLIGPALAQEVGALAGAAPDYRTFFGLNPRVVVWVVAELHLMFAAFVLGVPIFALIAEIVGVRTKDPRYDRLAHEFTALLSSTFSTTAALGGLLAFALIGLYPKFMQYLTGVFSPTYYVYALLFLLEGAFLYSYYYAWDRLQHHKWAHLLLGLGLNLTGTAIMVIANSWATFMMSPAGIEKDTGQFVGSVWQAHRFIANVAFGGFIVGACAAIRFLQARSAEERAHYDWMGYVGNFIGIAALIPLPFAGYWLGREVYSASPVMGNNMMGGAFSWPFIIQAVLIGMLFIGGNYYLWAGMVRIPGAERYTGYIKYLNVILFLCFAVWLTPRNLPLTAEEQIAMGGQFHPLLKYLGLMSAKNAAVNFIILSTFFSFLLYRRANKGRLVPLVQQGWGPRIALLVAAGLCLLILGAYARTLLSLDPAALGLTPDRAVYFRLPAFLLLAEMAAAVLAALLTFRGRGLLGQGLYLATTTLAAVFVLGVYGYVVMEKANPFLREIAFAQWLSVMSALILGTAIDIVVFQGAESVGGIRWGRMPARAQYALILLCVAIVMLMGLMGYIRSGLREDWHIYGVMQDTSAWAYTPTMADMTKVVGGITLVFLALVAFAFWLSGPTGRREGAPEVASVAAGGGADRGGGVR
ncbi:MAG: cytochrome ubiquinol oxidase subunit I [Deltaproteobacteria bacterium]|nr:cytochrome ubiquinol oxidase subunit I [Deltaproteobacteria bacterium]